MKNKIKILFIHHAAGWGGAPINMINIINKLDKTKFEPHVLLLKDSVVKNRLLELNIPFTLCTSSFYLNKYRYLSHTDAGKIKLFKVLTISKVFISWFLSKYVYASKVLKGFNYDIVHLNSSVLSDWIYPASKKGKVIYHIQEPISKGRFGFRYNFIRSEVAKYADMVIAISKDNADRINLPQKTKIVYNFIDIPNGQKIGRGVKSILYVGGWAKIKGISVLLDAIPVIDKSIQINMMGQYPKLKPIGKFKKIVYKLCYPSAYKLRNKLINISNFENVNIIGALPSIASTLYESSLVVSPFTVPHFSRPVIEAFAYGKPVVASDILGMDEIVNDAVDGILFKNGDAKALAKAINTLVNRPEKLKKMGENGRKKSNELFNPEINTKKVEEVYLELMNGRDNFK
ncbi:glycosyltransferase family 4 protein [Mesonia algae]|nr:glycosyltransferase family 4 protein [Mesonia algae]